MSTDTGSAEVGGDVGGDVGGLPAEFFDSLSNEVIQARVDAQEAKQITGRLREVLGDEKKSVNPLSWYDDVLDSLLEAEKNNRSMPMTAKLAAVLAETQKGLLELREETKRKDEIIKKLQNPVSNANNRAFAAMDDHITTMLTELYDEVPPAYHDAVASQLEGIIRDLMQNAPDKWEKIRRSDTYQKRLVAHCVEQLVPPKAKQKIMAQHEDERPTTEEDFMQAEKELAQMYRLVQEGTISEREFERVYKGFRQAMWEWKANGPQRYNSTKYRRR